MEKELWKDIEKYDSLYKISNLGRVYSVRRNIVMKTPKSSHGYPMAIFSIEGKRSVESVHRLVASAFVTNRNPRKYNIVNHIDEDKTNAKWQNLEWCDDYRNINYSMYRMKHKLSSPVLQYNLTGDFIKEYKNVGCTPFYSKMLIKACYEELEHEGYLWKYKNKLEKHNIKI